MRLMPPELQFEEEEEEEEEEESADPAAVGSSTSSTTTSSTTAGDPANAVALGRMTTGSWLRAEMPSVNTQASARGLARVAAAIVESLQPLQEDADGGDGDDG